MVKEGYAKGSFYPQALVLFLLFELKRPYNRGITHFKKPYGDTRLLRKVQGEAHDERRTGCNYEDWAQSNKRRV
jgi:hypothetical protein